MQSTLWEIEDLALPDVAGRDRGTIHEARAITGALDRFDQLPRRLLGHPTLEERHAIDASICPDRERNLYKLTDEAVTKRRRRSAARLPVIDLHRSVEDALVVSEDRPGFAVDLERPICVARQHVPVAQVHERLGPLFGVAVGLRLENPEHLQQRSFAFAIGPRALARAVGIGEWILHAVEKLVSMVACDAAQGLDPQQTLIIAGTARDLQRM